MKRAVSVFAAAVLLTASACGGSSGEAPSLFALLEDRHEAVARLPVPYQSVAEIVPSTQFRVNGGQPASIADAFVIGDVVDISPGRSFTWREDAEEETRVGLDFNDSEALISTIHLRVRVESSVLPPGADKTQRENLLSGTEISVGLALDAPVDSEAVRSELLEVEGVALPLTRSPVFDYDSELFAILGDGAFLGKVEGPSVIFPALLDELNGADGTPIDLLLNSEERVINVRTTDIGFTRD